MKSLFATSLLLCAALIPFTVQAQSEDWQALNVAITDNEVIPAYAGFAEAGAALATEGEGFCEVVDAESLVALQAAYHEAMDAWQAVQHIRFGPVTYFNWNYRLQYWPDDKGTSGRQMNALLASADSETLNPDNFARQSVAVQGFPALERLLFDEDSLSRLQDGGFRCQLVAAITANIGEISEGIHQRWVDEFSATVAMEDDSDYFADAQDASVDFVKALVETLPILSDQKLGLPLGEGYSAFRERRAESWRSQRSLRNLKINVDSLHGYFFGTAGQTVVMAGYFPEEDVQVISTIFDALQAQLAGLSGNFVVQASDEAGYEMLSEVQQQLADLYEAVEVAVKNTDLYLGFNSLDGD